MKRLLRNLLLNPAKILSDPNNQKIVIVAIFITLFSCLLFLSSGRTSHQGEIVSAEGTTSPIISTTSAISPTKWWIKVTPTLPSFGSKTSTPPQPVESNCTQATSSLRPGIFAYISLTPPFPNRIHSGAGQEFSYLGQIEPGHGVKILDGPLCTDSYTWWLVESSRGELQGWMADGKESEQWIIPCLNQSAACHKSPPLLQTTANSADKSKTNQDKCQSEILSPGILAQVNQDSLSVLRTKPHVGNVVGRVGPLSVVDIIGGPKCIGDVIWWEVNATSFNLSGWTTENSLRSCSKEDLCGQTQE